MMKNKEEIKIKTEKCKMKQNKIHLVLSSKYKFQKKDRFILLMFG